MSRSVLFIIATLLFFSCGNNKLEEDDMNPIGSAVGIVTAWVSGGDLKIDLNGQKILVGIEKSGALYAYDEEDGHDGEFVSVGFVKGLGAIMLIPQNGWTKKISAITGSGCVFRIFNGEAYNYIRMYFVEAQQNIVVGYNAYNGNPIIGATATICYQAPFIP